MPIPPKEIVVQSLEPIEAKLALIVRNAWRDWLDSSERSRSRYSRTRACIMFERMIAGAIETFQDDARIRLIEGQETISFLYDDKVLFRFKKADESGLSRNFPTQHALAFHDHEAILFSLPDIHRVDVVYVLNALDTDIQELLIVGRDQDRVAWVHDISQAHDQSLDNIEHLPQTGADDAGTERLVKPIGGKDQRRTAST